MKFLLLCVGSTFVNAVTHQCDNSIVGQANHKCHLVKSFLVQIFEIMERMYNNDQSFLHFFAFFFAICGRSLLAKYCTSGPRNPSSDA